MPNPLDLFAASPVDAAKPLSKILGDPGAPKPPKTEADRIFEARVREALPVGLAVLRFFPVTASYVTRPLFAVDFSKPGPPTLTRFAPLYALPQPIGIVPPSLYGLPPGYFGQIAPGLPPSTYFHTAPPTPEQVRQRQERILRDRLFVGTAVLNQTTGDLPIVTTAAEEVVGFIVRRVDALNHFFGEQLTGHEKGGVHHSFFGTTAITEGAANDPFAAGVAPGSVLLQLFQPVIDAAIRNQEAATGIRKELHSERADP